MIIYKKKTFFALMLISTYISAESIEPENIVPQEKEIYRVPNPLVNGLINFAAKLFLKKVISEIKDQNNCVRNSFRHAEETNRFHAEDGTRSMSFENFSEELNVDEKYEKQFIEEVKLLFKEWCA